MKKVLFGVRVILNDIVFKKTSIENSPKNKKKLFKVDLNMSDTLNPE